MFYEVHTHIDKKRIISYLKVSLRLFLSVSTLKEFEALFSQDKIMSRI